LSARRARARQRGPVLFPRAGERRRLSVHPGREVSVLRFGSRLGGFRDIRGCRERPRAAHLPTKYLNGWLKDDAVDLIFVCHSQGCNIAMQVLKRACER
jgi:hypothetical protein